jgi:transposase
LDIPDEEVIAYYHQLFQVEATFRMAKSDLKARPIYHRKRDAIEAHLTIVLAALAISRNIELQTELSIKQFVKLLRPIRSGIVTINGNEVLAEPEVPSSVQAMLGKLNSGH